MNNFLIFLLCFCIQVNPSEETNLDKQIFKYRVIQKIEQVDGKWTNWHKADAIIISETINWHQSKFTIYEDNEVKGYSVVKKQTLEPIPESEGSSFQWICLDKDKQICQVGLDIPKSADAHLKLGIKYTKFLVAYSMEPLD